MLFAFIASSYCVDNIFIHPQILLLEVCSSSSSRLLSARQ